MQVHTKKTTKRLKKRNPFFFIFPNILTKFPTASFRSTAFHRGTTIATRAWNSSSNTHIQLPTVLDYTRSYGPVYGLECFDYICIINIYIYTYWWLCRRTRLKCSRYILNENGVRGRRKTRAVSPSVRLQTMVGSRRTSTRVMHGLPHYCCSTVLL